MKIDRLSIDKLKFADYNPRKDLKSGDTEYEKLKRSIEHFGYVEPIIVNDRTGLVVGGHQRVKVLKDLGYTEIEVVHVDLDDTNEKALNIALNKISGDWDAEKLEDLLRELNVDTDIDMMLTGFDTSELDTLFSGAMKELDELDKENNKKKSKKDRERLNEEENIVDENTFDEEEELRKAIENTKAKSGDLYKLGNHYLLCGDATNKDDIQELTNGQNIKLCLTDPPYGISILGNKSNGDVKLSKLGTDSPRSFKKVGKIGGDHGSLSMLNSNNKEKVVKANLYIPVKGDETTETARLHYGIIKDISENQIIFGGNYFTDFLPTRACWIVWNKHAVANYAAFELAWTSYNKPAIMYDFLWAGLCKQGSRKDEGNKRVHPTQKPVGMLEMIIEDFTKENDSVIDCFGGSGSTLIACEKSNRQCFMIEYEPYYIDVIINRWEQYTGNKAEFIRNIRR